MTLSVATVTTVVSAALCTLSGNSLVEGLNNSSMEAPRHLTTVDAKFTHTLVGYWHDFDNPSGKSYPLSHISKDWDVIIVAFATNEGNGNVGFELDPAAGSEGQFIANIKSLQAAGKTIALSLGGQDGSVTLNDATETTNFVNSVYGLITKYGFNGIDLDLENGISQGLPIINNLISAVKQLRQKVGPSFYLSMAPEHPYVQGGYVSFGGTWGAYLPIIDGLRDELTQVHVQYYNNGGFTYTDGRIVNEGTVDCLVGGSVMLIEGFRTDYGTGWEFKGLRPDQVSFGVPSGPSSAMRGQATPEVVRRALTCLVQGVGCDRIKPPSLYSTFRGIMAWSIHWDSHDGFVFSRSARSVLDKLPVVHYESSRRVHITARPTTPSPERPAVPQATSKLCGDNHHICYWPFLKRALPFSKADCAKFPSDVFVWCP
ncbi:hypothetical protein LEN26_013946 [Aphanomyces euteiches]|nr:hypothetical protein LEN26_013946 [Aphanomyces euteiches]KAH9126164.1 hypothetical protein AeMF1_003378 [Aphanomyces euteiches]KAH9182054.1 hypothetical protein AeNC1_015969 [Aphanomyces euteiches]